VLLERQQQARPVLARHLLPRQARQRALERPQQIEAPLALTLA
jgi:hypothetical protein